MKYINILLLILVFCNCTPKKLKHNILTNGEITLVDSTPKTNNYWKYDSLDRFGYYPIFYIGKRTDTIFLSQETIPRYQGQIKDSFDQKKLTFANSLKMKIIVDTSFSLTHKINYDHYSYKLGRKVFDSTQSFKAYAVFIYNNCDSIFSIGRFSELGRTIRQAKNDKGDWIDIEAPISYFCGTGGRHIVLEPNQILIAKLMRYNGDYRTDCRLKFTNWKWTVYSNIYKDFIHKKQLTDSLRHYTN